MIAHRSGSGYVSDRGVMKTAGSDDAGDVQHLENLSVEAKGPDAEEAQRYKDEREVEDARRDLAGDLDGTALGYGSDVVCGRVLSRRNGCNALFHDEMRRVWVRSQQRGARSGSARGEV